MKTFIRRLKHYFLAGLIAILPFWATFFILLTVFRIIASVAKPYLEPIPYLSSFPLLLEVVSFLGTTLMVILLGIILTNVLGRRIFLWFDKRVQNLPILSWIYSSIRKLTTIFYEDGGASQHLRRVVMIEYPRKGMFVIGFVTSDALSELSKKAKTELVNVFLPTTPNPTSGFLLLVPKGDVTPLDMSTEDAIKLIVSAGIASPHRA